MRHGTVAELLTELRRSAASRRRSCTPAAQTGALMQLLAICRPAGLEERPEGLVFRLENSGEPRLRISCIVHHVASAPLTTAESEVAELLREGLTVPQIARLRGVSANTIKSQVRQIFRKLGVDSRVALVRRLPP